MTNDEIEKAWELMSKHNSELLLENESLKRQLHPDNNALLLANEKQEKRLMRSSLWYSLKRAVRIWMGGEQ